MAKITRRQFLKYSAMAGVAAALPLKYGVRDAHALTFINSPQLTKFGAGQTLRGLGPGGIPVAASDGFRYWYQDNTGVHVSATPPAPTAKLLARAVHYTVQIGEFQDQLHPALGLTTLWGYNPSQAFGVTGTPTPKHLGGVVVAQRGVPVQFTFKNNLPASHIIPVDTTVPGANQARNRTAVHVHGGYVPWISDGGPFDWWAPDGTHGLSFLNNQVLNPAAASNEAEYYYPNDQSARLVWYHDHAWGITRINAYAGIASGYVITDAAEQAITGSPGASNTIPFRQLPLVIQDKVFQPNNIFGVDPTWQGAAGLGCLWYAHIYDPKLYKLLRRRSLIIPPDPSVVPEFFGDTMLANGTVYPSVTVEPTRYRLRILNACNARVLNLQLYIADPANPDNITLNPKTLLPTNAKGPDFLVIGNEGGFLSAATVIPSNVPFNPVTLGGSLIMAPAERADVILDFTSFGLAPGTKLILYNDAPAPFPVGAPTNDYFLGNPMNPIQPLAGTGPDTRQIFQFVVGSLTGTADPAPIVPPPLPPIDPPAIVDQTTGLPVPGVVVTRTRKLTLNEAFDQYGRLIQLLGTDIALGRAGFGKAYLDAVTEIPAAGDVEIWEIYNLTGDTHPIHFHLVNVQVINRQAFRLQNFNPAVPVFVGLPIPPTADELGWKETVKMHPGQVTRVIMKFDLPVVPFNVPPSPRTGENEYVWHCHILEHEEHDMMRPLVVTGANPQQTLGVTPGVQSVPVTGGTATFTITGGAAPYTVVPSDATLPPSPSTVASSGGTFQVTVPATTAKTVLYTITDSSVPVQNVVATLEIV